MMSDYPIAEMFECIEPSFKHGHHTFRAGNAYYLEDYPDINQEELQMFHRAGWVKVEGWPETPARDTSRTVVLDVHPAKVGQRVDTI